MKKALIGLFFILLSSYLLAQPNQLEYDYDVSYYKLDLEVTNTSTYIEGWVTIKANVVGNPLDTFVVELTDSLTVDSVYIDNINHSFSHINNEIIIPLSSTISLGTGFSTRIYYYGNAPTIPAFNNHLGGLVNSLDITYDKEVTWSFSEAFYAKYWWPCKQVIGDKADSVDFFITTDTLLTPASIGKLNNIVTLSGGKHRYEWSTRHPFPYYMIFFAVSEYQEFSFYAYPENKDSILIQCFFYDSACWNYYSDWMTDAKNGIEYLSDIYGQYLFADEKYGYCAVPFNDHENLTITSMRPDFETFRIYHCLGHQWFAGNVTCENYRDIWVHEGFASYTEYLCMREFSGELAAYLSLQWSHNNVMSSPGGSVYVPVAEEWNQDRLYDHRLTYWKGELLLHMIRFQLDNDSMFYDVLRSFNTLYSGGNATGLDFKAVLENVSSIDFTDFFDQWYFGEGFPTYDIVYYVQNDSLTIISTQTTSTPITPLFTIPMEYRIMGYNIETTLRLYQTQNVQTFTIYFPDSIWDFTLDPMNWVINKEGSIVESIAEVNQDALNLFIFPNPTTGRITIKAENINKIELSDIQGKQVYTGKNTTIDLSQQPQGIYIIKVTTNKQTITKKIIKQ